MEMSDLTLDLFSGAGGITEGFRQAGFNCVFANDADQDASATFRMNHPGVETSSEPIESLDPKRVRRGLLLERGEVDCLVGGPPCQGFSINAPARLLEDPRNDLALHYLSFVREFLPKTLMFENVPGILSFNQGATVQAVLSCLSDLGYRVSWKILFAGHYGVPQERWRFVILASRLGTTPSLPPPTHAASGRANFRGGRIHTFKPSPYEMENLLPLVSVEQALGDLPALPSASGTECAFYSNEPHSAYATAMRCGSDMLWHHVAPRLAEINLERLRHIEPGGSWRDLPFELLPKGMKLARRSDHTRRYGRLKPEGLAGTVMTKMDPHWGPAFHYSQDRSLTVREAARLQSFPDKYRFTGSRVSQFRQVGNAVPVLLAKAVAGRIRESLEGERLPALDSR